MSPLLHFNTEDYAYVIRSDGNRSKRYRHWCLSCQKDRGYGYLNKIKKESHCHSCKMQLKQVKEKISVSSKRLKHSEQSKRKISSSLYRFYGTTEENRKLTRNLRSRLNKAIKANSKTGSAIRDLGCSIDQLKLHLESKWQSGMNWDNYGRSGWHIDHIKPLCSFDLKDAVQLKEACHYTNLQPLWSTQNLDKRKHDGTYR